VTSVKMMVGGSLADTKRRALDAVTHAKAGQLAEPENYITFQSWKALASVLTDKRYQLLHQLRQTPSKDIAMLARQLKRDYKRVCRDVEALEAAGLIERDKSGLHTKYDTIRAELYL
jgi:predicted transcriptional regulator